jgi:hypothetical protein
MKTQVERKKLDMVSQAKGDARATKIKADLYKNETGIGADTDFAQLKAEAESKVASG